MNRKIFSNRILEKGRRQRADYAQLHVLSVFNKMEKIEASNTQEIDTLIDDAVFYFGYFTHDADTLETTCETIGQIPSKYQNDFFRKAIKEAETRGAARKQTVCQALMDFWAHNDVPTNSFLWDVALEISEWMAQENNGLGVYIYYFSLKMKNNFDNPGCLEKLKSFPYKGGMLQASVEAPDEVFEDFLKLEYDAREWENAIVYLLNTPISRDGKRKRLARLLDDRCLVYIKDLAYPLSATRIICSMESLGFFEFSEKIKKISKTTAEDHQIFYYSFVKMRHYDTYITDEFLEKYQHVVLEKTKLAMVLEAVIGFYRDGKLNDHSRKLSPLPEEKMMFYLNTILTQHQNEPPEVISEVCLNVLLRETSYWSTLPKFRVVERLLQEMNNDDKQTYLEHCGKDKRTKLIKKLIKSMGWKTLNDLSLGAREWNENNRVILCEAVSQKERNIISKELNIVEKPNKAKSKM